MSYVPIGRVHSPQGVRGQLFIHIFAGEAAWVDQWTELHLVEKDGALPQVSHPIIQVKPHHKQGKWGLVVSLAEVTNRNQIEAYKGWTVLIPESFLVSQEGEGLYLREVLDFQVIDRKRGEVGRVRGFSGNSQQDLLVIETPGGEEFLVPFVDALTESIDKPGRRILMDIPWGLLPGEDS